LPTDSAVPVPAASTSGDPGGAGRGQREDGDRLADLRRESQLESLPADGTMAAASVEHGYMLDRALNAGPTAVPSRRCAVIGCDSVLGLVFGSAYS
jgi:hypothetical protein